MQKALNERILIVYPLLFTIAGSLAFIIAMSASSKESLADGYLPAWNSVCGIGRKLSEGCKPVRARDIVDASKYPWSAIGRVNFAGHRTYMHCTGSLIGERIVLTAAHCLYNDITKKWLQPQNIHFLAGYQRGGQTAHSKAVRYVVSDKYDPKTRSHRYDPKADWAVLELQKPIGAATGYLGWYKLDSAGLKNTLQSGGRIALAGYPAIRQHVISVDKDCKQAMFSTAGDLVIHECAGAQGDSGGPILLLENGKATILSINSGVTREQGKVVWTSVPIASFYEKIFDVLGSKPSLQQINGQLGVSGRPPTR